MVLMLNTRLLGNLTIFISKHLPSFPKTYRNGGIWRVWSLKHIGWRVLVPRQVLSNWILKRKSIFFTADLPLKPLDLHAQARLAVPLAVAGAFHTDFMVRAQWATIHDVPKNRKTAFPNRWKSIALEIWWWFDGDSLFHLFGASIYRYH